MVIFVFILFLFDLIFLGLILAFVLIINEKTLLFVWSMLWVLAVVYVGGCKQRINTTCAAWKFKTYNLKPIIIGA